MGVGNAIYKKMLRFVAIALVLMLVLQVTAPYAYADTQSEETTMNTQETLEEEQSGKESDILQEGGGSRSEETTISDSSNDTSYDNSNEETEGNKDEVSPMIEDTSQATSAEMEETTPSRLRSDPTSNASDYLDIDVDFSKSGSTETVKFTAYVNKDRATLINSSLTHSLSGDYDSNSLSVEVYSLASTGAATKLTEGSGYTISGNVITFTDPDLCYQVNYSVTTTKSFVNASMDSSDTSSVSVAGVFTLSYEDASGTQYNGTKTRSYQPLTWESENKGLKNGSILTGLTAAYEEGKVTLDYTWALDGLYDGSGNLINLNVKAGDYFVFKVDSNQIEIYNSSAGYLYFGSTVIGSYYLDKDSATVIFVFNSELENLGNRTGYFTVTSYTEETEGKNVEITVDLNSETKVVMPSNLEADLDIAKSGSLSGQVVTWTATIDAYKVENLEITDTDDPNGNRGGAWTFDNSSAKVYVSTKDSNGNQIWQLLTEGNDYTETSTTNVNGETTKTIAFTETVSKTYMVVWTGTTASAAYGITYENTVKASGDNEGLEDVSATADVTSKNTTAPGTPGALGKDAISFDSEASALTWNVRYNTNKTSIPIANAGFTDQYKTAYWYGNNKEVPIAYTIDLDSIKVYIQGDSSETSVLLTKDTDYRVTETSDGFSIQLLDSLAVTGESGYLTKVINIYYDVKLDLSNPPSDAEGWYTKNAAYGNDGGQASGEAGVPGIWKYINHFDYSTQYANWGITINQTGLDMPDGTKVYDILSDGFKMAVTYNADQLNSNTFRIINSRTEEYVAVYKESAAIDADDIAKGYFTYDESGFTLPAGAVTNAGKTISAGQGYVLTYHKGTDSSAVSANKSTDCYAISYLTKMTYSELKYDDDGKLITTNYAYLYSDGKFYMEHSADLDVDLSSGGGKSGMFIQSETDSDGNYVSSKLLWMVIGNYWNANIDGAQFYDELQNGQDKDGNEISGSIQSITASDVHIYSIIVDSSTGEISYPDVIEDLTQYGAVIEVIDNKIIINFADNYSDRLKAAGITNSDGSANMRFVVVIEPTLEGEIAYKYPNTATLTSPGGSTGDLGEWKATVEVDSVKQSASKIGTLNDDGTISYSAVFNKNQKQISNLEISDSLAYDDDGDQILYLDEGSLKIYEAVIVVDDYRNVTYGEGKVLVQYEEGMSDDEWDYKLVYNQSDKNGFYLIFNSNYILDKVPLVIKYDCHYNRIDSGTTVKNSISLKGSNAAESSSSVYVRYTTTSGGGSGTTLSFSIKKVDKETRNSLTGARFRLWNSTKLYVVDEGYVDENGELTFKNIIEGTYYLEEVEVPNGYNSTIDSVNKAIKITVTEGDDGKAVVKIDNQDVLNDGFYEVENSRNVGSLKLVKYANDEEGNHTTTTLKDAKFYLYTLDDTGNELYYYGEDDNGIAVFSAEEEPRTLSTDQDGIIVVDNLPIGTYYIKESMAPDGYQILAGSYEFSIKDAGETVGIELYNDVETDDETTKVSVEKVWNDNDDQDGIRPDSIQVQLYADGEKYGDVMTLNSASNWTYTWNNLPKNNSNMKIDYTVKEVSVPDGYEASYSDDTFTITNAHEPKETERTVIKVWDDNNNQDGVRPDNVTVQLKANGSNCGEEITLSEENNWSYTWSNLALYSNGDEITYSIVEVDAPDEYEITYSEDGTTFTVTNSYTSGEVSRTVSKNWNDSEDQAGIRPGSIQVQLYADGEKYGDVVTLNSANNWTFTWNNLPKYNSNTEIDYNVKEVSVPNGYEASYSDDTFTITNTYTREETEQTVTKLWEDNNNQDGIRPDSIQVQLYANDEAYGDTVTLHAANNWSYTWNNLMKYDSGAAIHYSVKEVSVPDGYEASYSDDTFTITNTYTPKETERTVIKVWNDNNNQDGVRPDNVTVQLKANGSNYGEEITLSEENNWSYTWSNLAVYANGKEIIYTIAEVNTPTEYAVTYSEDKTTFTITNSYTPGEISRAVSKNWNDNNDQDGIRPDSIQVQLYADGEEYGDAVTLNTANNWSYTWNNLPRYDSGATIHYTVKEVSVPNGYKASYSDDTFTITNTHEPTKTVTSNSSNKTNTSSKSSLTSKSPSTNDSSQLWLWLFLLLGGGFGITVCLRYRKKERN